MWRVRALSDKNEIWAILQRDRLWAAYAIGDLEPEMFEWCEWYAAEAENLRWAFCLLFRGLDPPALFTMGEAEGVAAILESALHVPRVYFASEPRHLSTLQRYYDLSQMERMLRMTVVSSDFRPVPGLAFKLTPQHLDALKALYELGGGAAFADFQLEKGVFYGIETDGRLVATAGTHLIAPNYGLAAVGNVTTHPDYRHRGYATVCSSAVTQELLARGLDVVLNVGKDNAAAVRVYEKLGYWVYCKFVESLGQRKS